MQCTGGNNQKRVLSALIDELGFDTLASPTNGPVNDYVSSSEIFFWFYNGILKDY